MDPKNLKCVVGQVCEDKPAVIRFFDSVDRWSVDCFKEEFLWLQDYVKPSKIVVQINSDGGSVISGMSAFALISQCPIETDCVIEGMAASMGSVIWAAGKNLYMHDYSILMIHNPYISGSCDDPNAKAIVDAFKDQLKVVYTKRLGLTEEEVTAIMDGKDGVDGTYLSATDAVNRGIISADHVIMTPEATKAQLKEELEKASKTRCAVDFEKIVAKVETIDKAPKQEPVAVLNEDGNNKPNNNKQMNQEFQTVAALMGFDETAQLSGVSAKITELMNAKAELDLVKAERDDLNGKVLAHEATIKNLQANLDSANAELTTFKEAENQRKAAEISAMLDGAIKAGKITEETKAKWEAFFATNAELAKDSLDAIPARVIVTEQIANDPQAQAQAVAKQKELEEAEKKAQEAVAKVVGDFEFSKFNA